jgi:5-methyltetrahydrofolate--homocysteine methyltransferase
MSIAQNDQERQLVAWLADMNEDDAVAMAKRMLLEEGVDAMHVLGLCREAMDIVGKRFEEGEYFLPELVLAGEMLDNVGAIAKPLIKQDGGGAAKLGKVLIGTVHGDLHDIGKNIVTFMLDINGFEVKDIGVDVPVQTFIAEIKAYQPDVVGLSGFLTLAFDSMKETITAFDAAGLRNDFKIMIGGGQIDETVRAYTGADAFGVNAVEAVSLCRDWMGVAA